LSSDLHRRRRRITGSFIAGLPKGLAGGRVKAHDASAAATDVHQQLAGHKQWRAACSKIAFVAPVVGEERARPQFLARIAGDRVQVARSAKGIDDPTSDERHAAGPDIGINTAAVASWKISLPLGFAASSIETHNLLIGSDTVKRDDLLAEYGNAGIAAAKWIPPKSFRPSRRPRVVELLGCGMPIPEWTEDLRPISAVGPAREQRETDRDEQLRGARQHIGFLG
jgi:hypothetical protein